MNNGPWTLQLPSIAYGLLHWLFPLCISTNRQTAACTLQPQLLFSYPGVELLKSCKEFGVGTSDQLLRCYIIYLTDYFIGLQSRTHRRDVITAENSKH